VIFTGKAFVLKHHLNQGYDAAQLIFNYQVIVAFMYAFIAIVYLRNTLPTIFELALALQEEHLISLDHAA